MKYIDRLISRACSDGSMPISPVPPAEGAHKHIRELQIHEYVKGKGRYCTADELVQAFGVSPVTIHRDLTSLAQKGLVRKLTGGVELVSRASPPGEHHFSARINRRSSEKALIAGKALPFVHEGDFIFLDSSTTAYHLAKRIQQSGLGDLTLMTNSILIIQEFHLFPAHMQLLAVAGQYRPQLHALLGRSSLQSLGGLKPKRLFFSAATVHHEHGLQSFHEDHAEFLAALIERCDECVLLADSSKFDRESLFRIAHVGAVQAIITDDGLDPSIRERYQAVNRQVI